MFASKQLGHFIAALCALVLTVGSAWAQAATVTGTVVDKNNVPIKGVYVVVEGTTIGTSTDVAGVYRIPASSYGTLQFTCIGYKTQYVAIAGRTVINVI